MLLLLSAPGVASSQTTPSEKNLRYELHYRTVASGFVRVCTRWKANSIAELAAEVEGGRDGRVPVAFARLHGETWTIETGRVVFALGDERLVAANRDRGIRERGWDGARIAFRAEDSTVHVLAGKRGADHLSALALATPLARGMSVEPYLIRSRGIMAAGVRLFGSAGRYDYNVELVSEGHGIWAGHWEIGAPVRATKMTLECNYATVGFDELHPGVLNAYGTEDPFPWSGTRNTALNFEQALSRNLHLSGSYRSYWSASGSYLAQHAVAALSYRRSHWTLDAGCGRLLAVRSADAPRWTPYVALSFVF